MLTSRNISITIDDFILAKQMAKEADLSFSAFIRELIRDRAKVSNDAA